jgi:SPX domain protein involved in polyphosphate accumulation
MKFGKDLEQYKVKGWEDAYIDYKGLKTILKRLEEENPDVDDIDSDFFQALEEELEKVNRVFHER